MNCEVFKTKVNAIILSSGLGITVRFFSDDKGRLYAYCSDGTTIVGCSSCMKVTVKWGSGHISMAVI